MGAKVLVLVGTKKGAFILESGDGRKSWELRGPLCEAWPLNHVAADAATGTIYAGGGSEWFGPAVWKSTDLGRSWTHSSQGLGYDTGEPPLKSVWSLAARNGSLYAGVEPAGLFRSDDGGESWRHVAGLREHPSRPDWQPGGAGLILHSLIPDLGLLDNLALLGGLGRRRRGVSGLLGDILLRSPHGKLHVHRADHGPPSPLFSTGRGAVSPLHQCTRKR